MAFASATATFNLPPGLLASICYVESNHVVSKVNTNDNGSSSYGVCQLKFHTARQMGFKGDQAKLLNPQVNVYYAARYLSHQHHRYRGDVLKTIGAYNAGSYRLSRRTGAPINQEYINKVLKVWEGSK